MPISSQRNVNNVLKNAAASMKWLPDMDLNHDKQIQSLLCYRYTIGQTSSFKVEVLTHESRMDGCYAR